MSTPSDWEKTQEKKEKNDGRSKLKHTNDQLQTDGQSVENQDATFLLFR